MVERDALPLRYGGVRLLGDIMNVRLKIYTCFSRKFAFYAGENEASLQFVFNKNFNNYNPNARLSIHHGMHFFHFFT